MSKQIKVCMVGGAFPGGVIGDYFLQNFSLAKYVPDLTIRDILIPRIKGQRVHSGLSIFYSAEAVDKLYRDRTPWYLLMVKEFLSVARNSDIVVFYSFNPIHPEILVRELKGVIKVLGFTDDPISTYIRGIPYIWACDGAFFISPSYNEESLMQDRLKNWGMEDSHWMPLSQPFDKPEPTEIFFERRNVDVVYVGNAYGTKMDRLTVLKRHFADRLKIHGRWPYFGYFGFLRGFAGMPLFPWRVTPLSDAQKQELYYNAKIGINMHYSTGSMEIGNMRMYELPAHGVMQICDTGGCESHAKIFKPNKEVIYYTSTNEAIELIEYYLSHDDERTSIAQAGFHRFWKDYKFEDVLIQLLNWAIALPLRH